MDSTNQAMAFKEAPSPCFFLQFVYPQKSASVSEIGFCHYSVLVIRGESRAEPVQVDLCVEALCR